MAYEKQIWNKYDDLKTEEENIENGAVVTDNRMNHIEEGIEAHTADLKNPHKVTAAQVGLSNVQNFGLATEDEAKQGISNAKYMTPSLTQAVLSANINSIAYANTADGTDGFTTVYPNLNLLTGSRTYSKSNPYVLTGSGTDYNIWIRDVTAYLKAGIYTLNAQTDGVWVDHKSTTNPNDKGVGLFILSSKGEFGIQLGKTVPKTITIPSDGQYIIRVNLYSDGTTTVSRKFWNFKLEPGSTATPYMPSSSEVTTADWPKYVGFSNAVKTNKSASDYTWFPVKDSELTNKVDSHINNKSNPHGVTASQVGAYSKTETDSKLALKANDSEVVHKSGNETISGSKNFASITVTDTFTERTTTVDITGFYTLTLTLRRTGNDVELISTRAAISGATGHEQTDAGFTIPSGFRPISRALAKVEMNNSTTLYNPMILRLDSDGKTYLTNDVFSNSRYAQCYANWKTNDPWPS